MEELLPLIISASIGLFVGLRLLRTPPPEVVVVHFEPEPTQSDGCLSPVLIVVLVVLGLLLLS